MSLLLISCLKSIAYLLYTLPITDVVQWILKESSLLISYLLFLPSKLADGLKRNTTCSSAADDRGTLVIRKVCRQGAVLQFHGPGIQAWFTIDV